MKRREFLSAATALGASSLVGESFAAGRSVAGFQSTGQPWPLRSSDSYTYDSREVEDQFAIGVWSPAEFFEAQGLEAGATAMDVVYVLDGSWALGLTASICMLQLFDLVKPGFPPLLLVGVDYPQGAMNSRSRDYTMSDSVFLGHREYLEASAKTRPGGAKKFLRFLENELDPFIRNTYNCTDNPAGILGASFGGTFTFYAFLQQSNVFNRFWLGSPGIFTTNTDYTGQFEELLQGDLVHDTKMYLSFGEAEAGGGIDFYEDMGRNFNRLTSALSRHPNEHLDWDSKIYPGHTHATIVGAAISDALFYLYGPHQP